MDSVTEAGREGALGMAQPAGDDWLPENPADVRDVDEPRGLPIDPDLDSSEDERQPRDVDESSRRPRSRWPRIHWATAAAVAVGGFGGGLTRYGIGLAWPAPTVGFPWAIWTVNTAGAFILGLLLVLVLEVLPPTRYVRALVGTGFCGALTTFSSVATGIDQLAAHGHAALAGGYLAGSLAAGLAAGSFGMTLGRSIAAYSEKGRE
jgi:CrcB protein